MYQFYDFLSVYRAFGKFKQALLIYTVTFKQTANLLIGVLDFVKFEHLKHVPRKVLILAFVESHHLLEVVVNSLVVVLRLCVHERLYGVRLLLSCCFTFNCLNVVPIVHAALYQHEFSCARALHIECPV